MKTPLQWKRYCVLFRKFIAVILKLRDRHVWIPNFNSNYCDLQSYETLWLPCRISCSFPSSLSQFPKQPISLFYWPLFNVRFLCEWGLSIDTLGFPGTISLDSALFSAVSSHSAKMTEKMNLAYVLFTKEISTTFVCLLRPRAPGRSNVGFIKNILETGKTEKILAKINFYCRKLIKLDKFESQFVKNLI
jgi:hypothetical protein